MSIAKKILVNNCDKKTRGRVSLSRAKRYPKSPVFQECILWQENIHGDYGSAFFDVQQKIKTGVTLCPGLRSKKKILTLPLANKTICLNQATLLLSF